MKYLITIQTRLTQFVEAYFFLLKNRFLTDFKRLLVQKNQLLITFCSDLICNKTLKARNSTPTHTNILLNPIKK